MSDHHWLLIPFQPSCIQYFANLSTQHQEASRQSPTSGFVDANIDPEPLMNIFKAMIKLQLTAENERVLGIRTNSHDYDAKYNKIKTIPDYL